MQMHVIAGDSLRLYLLKSATGPPTLLGFDGTHDAAVQVQP
jgi:hypothetical protein